MYGDLSQLWKSELCAGEKITDLYRQDRTFGVYKFGDGYGTVPHLQQPAAAFWQDDDSGNADGIIAAVRRIPDGL